MDLSSISVLQEVGDENIRYLCAQKLGESDPYVLVAYTVISKRPATNKFPHSPVCPSLKVEDGIGRVSRDLLQQLSNAFSLGLKRNVIEERRVEIDGVQSLKAGAVFHYGRAACYCVDEPRLASYVPGVQDCLAMALEHYIDQYMRH